MMVAGKSELADEGYQERWFGIGRLQKYLDTWLHQEEYLEYENARLLDNLKL